MIENTAGVTQTAGSNTLPPSGRYRLSGRPTRRALLQAIVAIVALAASAMLAGCGTRSTPGATLGRSGAMSARPTPGATSGGLARGSLVMVIRHGEKPDGSHPGVMASARSASALGGWSGRSRGGAGMAAGAADQHAAGE
jgi:hypothetical protein